MVWVVGVQRGEDQVAGLGGGDDRRDGLSVAHLADHDDVRVLAHRVAQRLGEVDRVRAHLALGDRGHVVREQELHGVLDGDHVDRAGAGDVLDQGGEGGRFAAARRARDQHQALVDLAEVDEGAGQLQLLDRLDLVRDPPERSRHGAPLHVDVAAEAGEARDPVADVDRQALFEPRLLGRRQDAQQHPLELVGPDRLGLHRQQATIDAQQGRAGRLQVQIRRTFRRHEPE
jgi:hypothetical protein